MYSSQASVEELAVFGLTPEDYDTEAIKVLPDLWDSYLVFDSMTTQWRTGMGGPTGLDYTAIPVVYDALGLAKEDYQRIFFDVRLMEAEVLRLFSEKEK